MPTYADTLTYGDVPAYGSWPVPARNPADVWRGMPAWFVDAVDVLRDGLGDALALVALRGGSAVAKASVGHLRAHAKGWQLDLVVRGLGTARATGEDDIALRSRLAIVEDCCSPNAIRSLVNGILAPVTSTTCQLVEPWKHGCYCFRSFTREPPVDWLATIVQNGWAGLPSLGSSATLVTYTRVGDVRVFSGWPAGTCGIFWLFLPALGGLGTMFLRYLGAFIAGMPLTGTGWAFLRYVPPTSLPFAAYSRFLSTYRAIASAVDRARAAGVRWHAHLEL